jgi:hypothetical protein
MTNAVVELPCKSISSASQNRREQTVTNAKKTGINHDSGLSAIMIQKAIR